MNKEQNNYFFQIVPMTDEEKMKMYMELPKEKVCQMLIECNKIIENIKPQIMTTQFNEQDESNFCSSLETITEETYDTKDGSLGEQVMRYLEQSWDFKNSFKSEKFKPISYDDARAAIIVNINYMISERLLY